LRAFIAGQPPRWHPKALGLTLPLTPLGRADEVIECIQLIDAHKKQWKCVTDVVMPLWIAVNLGRRD
jgi:hypothetical protein